MNKLSTYKSSLPGIDILGEGTHDVRLVSYHVTDSFHNYDGTLKSPGKPYANPCEQLAVTFVALDKSGVITHRLNAEGYKVFSLLPQEQQESGEWTDVDGYACKINEKTGKLERQPDDIKTAKAEGIFDQFFYATGLPENSGIEDLDFVIAEQTPMRIKVINDIYEGRDQFRVSRFYRYSDNDSAKDAESDEMSELDA